MALGTIIALAISLVAAVILYKVLKKVSMLVLNGLLGVATFWILDIAGIIHVSIDIWTFLIAAIGGLVGVAVVIILTILGIPI